MTHDEKLLLEKLIGNLKRERCVEWDLKTIVSFLAWTFKVEEPIIWEQLVR